MSFAAWVKKGEKFYGQRSMCESKIHYSLIPSCGELVNRSSKNYIFRIITFINHCKLRFSLRIPLNPNLNKNYTNFVKLQLYSNLINQC